MLSSSRFMVAVHALSVIARMSDGRPICSSIVAASVNTNPVVIRRLMRDLERASLVASVTGRAGGFILGRQAARITLADYFLCFAIALSRSFSASARSLASG